METRPKRARSLVLVLLLLFSIALSGLLIRDRFQLPDSPRRSAPVARGVPQSDSERQAGHAPLQLQPQGGDGMLMLVQARTLAGIPRLQMLEYLAMPEAGEKAHECLAVVAAKDWPALQLALQAKQREIELRWTDARQQLVCRKLADLLPWAHLDASDTQGIGLGGNKDESRNSLLPPDNTPIQIAIRMRQLAPKDAWELWE